MAHGAVLDEFRRQCLQTPGRIGFPESDDGRMLLVADELLREGAVAAVRLYTARGPTEALAREAGVDLGRHGARVEWAHEAHAPDLATRLGDAADHLASGALDCVLGGNQAATADVIRAGIKRVGLAPGVKTVSGSFIMNRPSDGTVYLYADCGVVIAPTVEQLADIATESVRLWRVLFPAVPPVVAFLSFSTKGSARHDAATRVIEATRLFESRHPDVDADGELQFDAAFDAAIGNRKAPGSPVPGRANVFIFPDLGAGNIAYKITQRLAGFEAYGPILQGLAKPFSDLSRGSTVADIRASAYVNLIRARAGAGESS